MSRTQEVIFTDVYRCKMMQDNIVRYTIFIHNFNYLYIIHDINMYVYLFRCNVLKNWLHISFFHHLPVTYLCSRHEFACEGLDIQVDGSIVEGEFYCN